MNEEKYKMCASSSAGVCLCVRRGLEVQEHIHFATTEIRIEVSEVPLMATSQTQEANSCASIEPRLGYPAMLKYKTVLPGCPTMLKQQNYLQDSKRFKLAWKRFVDPYCDSALSSVMTCVS